MKFLLAILFFPFFSSAQTTYTGTVTNKHTNAAVPYATVGLIKENTGINADENGHFVLKSSMPKLGDTLIISSVGYIPQRIALTGATDSNLNIQLTEQIAILNDVVVVPNYKWQKQVLNDFSGCGNNAVTSSGYLQQVAQHFIAPKENSRLISIRICRIRGNPSRSTFRIRVYGTDTLTGGPGEDLCDKVIEVNTAKPIVKLNVEEYKIRIPGKDFFVAIEWLKIPGNEQNIKYKTSTPPAFRHIMYSPVITWNDITGDSEPEAWQLNYNSKWKPLSTTLTHKKTLLIAATIKY